VIRTRVGYAGGTTPRPTYRNIGDHAETVELDIDPAVTSYARLLEAFWEGHDPGRPLWSRQYMAAVFYHDAEQERLARETAARRAAQMGRPMATQVLPAGTFTLAEDYHQKFYLQQVKEVWREFQTLYPAMGELIDSTAASRCNGYLAGCGSAEALAVELPGFGLSEVAQQQLWRLVGRR
jgi:peptide-methionine (S)-S-oxide reductase